MKRKVVLISSGPPSLNPRLVKEADSLTGAGYEVLVLYLYRNKWGENFDRDLLAKRAWRAIRVAGAPDSARISYLFSRLLQRFAMVILSFTGFRFLIPELAVSRGAFFLWREARKHEADLYIGHNVAALPVVVAAAGHHSAQSGFDAEDFHRHEITDDALHVDVRLKRYLEDKYLPHLSHLTAASPLIAAQYSALYPGLFPRCVLNVCQEGLGGRPQVCAQVARLKLFWFSQTIGSGRGLEEVLRALSSLPAGSWDLHLLGELWESEKVYFLRIAAQYKLRPEDIHVHPPVPPDELVPFASCFDVGLATETGPPFNRDICLTNKLFTYIQAGLAVVASDTSAQRDFLFEYPDLGTTYERQNPRGLEQALKRYLEDRSLLRRHKAAAYAAGQQKLNWQSEQHKFLSLVESVIGR